MDDVVRHRLACERTLATTDHTEIEPLSYSMIIKSSDDFAVCQPYHFDSDMGFTRLRVPLTRLYEARPEMVTAMAIVVANLSRTNCGTVRLSESWLGQ